MAEDVLPVLIVFGAAVLIVFFALQAQHRRRELEHKERMQALEKGLPIPPSLTAERPKFHNPYVAALVWIAIGVGLVIMSWPIGEGNLAGVAAIPLCIGIALLIANIIHQRQLSKEKLPSDQQMGKDI
jgi:hypothetical protein